MTLSVEDIGHGTVSLLGSTIAQSENSAVTRVTHCVFFNLHTVAVSVVVYYLRDSETIASPGAVIAKKQIAPSTSWVCIEAIGQNVGNSASLLAIPSVGAVVDYNVSGDVIS